LLDFYEQQQKLVEVNGNQEIEQVHSALLSQVYDHVHTQKVS
jgi:adenylate kinase family enzyme